MLSVDLEVASVNVVALEHHLKDLRLVDSALLHKVDYFVLHRDGVVHVVVDLHLDLVLHLATLFKELLIVNWVSKVLIVFGQQTQFTVVDPIVVLVTHGVLSPNTAVLASAEQEELVNLLVQMLPVEHVRNPCQTVGKVEEGQSQLPSHTEGVHEEDVPTEGHSAVQQHIGVLEVNGRVLDVVACVEQEFTLAVEGHSLAWLVDLIGALKILLGTLGQLSLSCVHDLVKVVNLAEASLLGGKKVAGGCQ